MKRQVLLVGYLLVFSIPMVSQAQKKDGLLGRLKKSTPEERLTVSNVGENTYIGIGELQDSVSGLSRSFGLYRLLLERPITRGGEPIRPVLVDYIFNAPYAVTGVVGSKSTILRVYKKGKRVGEISVLPYDWQSTWLKLKEWLDGDPAVLKKRESIDVNEGSIYDFPKHTPITTMMPGSEMEIKMVGSDMLNSTSYLDIDFMSRKEVGDPYKYLCESFFKYRFYSEKSLYFFDSDDVPDDAKKAARSFVFPLYRTPRPSLQYLGTSTMLMEEKDLGAAFQACLAALSSSDDIFIGPQEQALIREKTYQRMAELQLSISPKRKMTQSLFLFAGKLNGSYASDTLAISESKAYYKALDPLKEQLKKTTEMAYKIKGARFQGIMSAAGAFAGGLGASFGGASQAATQPYLKLMENSLNQTITTTSVMQKKMNDLFNGMDQNVNARSFLAGQELDADFGKPLVAAEVYYHLSKHPNLIKEALGEYSADKPKLYKLLREFYLGKNPTAVIPKIYEQFVLIEQAILNYEVRGMAVPESVLDKF